MDSLDPGSTTDAVSVTPQYAVPADVIEPNHAHAREMLDDELNARAHGVGLWGACVDS